MATSKKKPPKNPTTKQTPNKPTKSPENKIKQETPWHNFFSYLPNQDNQPGEKKKISKNLNLYSSYSSKPQTSQVRLWQSWSKSAQCWEELWSRRTLCQAHIKSVLASIICKTQRADPECHSESAQSCWVWV